MTVASGAKRAGQPLTLPAWGARAITAQGILLVAAAWALPAAAHLAGLPVRQFLPMHWPVILAGLVYGWRAGVALGLLAPCVSFLISGMPVPQVLPAMTLELAAYGFLAGFARQNLRWNAFLSAAVALLGGRTLFLVMAVATGGAAPGLPVYVMTAMAPGLIAALGQLILLPALSLWWVRPSRGPVVRGGGKR